LVGLPAKFYKYLEAHYAESFVLEGESLKDLILMAEPLSKEVLQQPFSDLILQHQCSEGGKFQHAVQDDSVEIVQKQLKVMISDCLSGFMQLNHQVY
jgi:hypothetical protein